MAAATDKPFSIRFTADLRARIDADAKALGISRTEWLAAAAEVKLNKPTFQPPPAMNATPLEKPDRKLRMAPPSPPHDPGARQPGVIRRKGRSAGVAPSTRQAPELPNTRKAPPVTRRTVATTRRTRHAPNCSCPICQPPKGTK